MFTPYARISIKFGVSCPPSHKNSDRQERQKAEGRKQKAPYSQSRRSWDEVMQEASNKTHNRYCMSGSVLEGDWIEHATFGLGCVQAFTPPNKVSVRFADSTKPLICNQNP